MATKTDKKTSLHIMGSPLVQSQRENTADTRRINQLIHIMANEQKRVTAEFVGNVVLVRDTNSMRLLWEGGYFGKGLLSRSEPIWRFGRSFGGGMRHIEGDFWLTQKQSNDGGKVKVHRLQ